MSEAELYVRQALASHIDGTGDVLWLAPDLVVSVTDFVTFFGSSIELALRSARDVYGSLVNDMHVFEFGGSRYEMTSLVMGYKDFFDACHSEGLI